jgi:hypothetical protein
MDKDEKSPLLQNANGDSSSKEQKGTNGEKKVAEDQC